MHPALRFRFGNALHAVHPAFEFKLFVRALAVYVENRLFYSAELGFAYIDYFRFKAVTFAVV